MPDLSNYHLIKRLSTGYVDTFIAEDIGNGGGKYSIIKRFSLNEFSPSERQYLVNLFNQIVVPIYMMEPHQQLTSINNYFEQFSSLYSVESYIEGHSLGVEITPGKQLSESYAIAFLQNTLIPLSWLHQQNIVHGNIHPANLFRQRQDGKIILTDIGNVKQVWLRAIASLKRQSLNSEGGEYLPPRYPLDRRTFDSDIYGLGAIAIQAMSGLPIAQLVNYPDRELIVSRQLQITPAFRSFLERMVSPDEAERFKSAREVLVALDKVKEEQKVTNQATINVVSPHGSASTNSDKPLENSAESTAIASPMPKKLLGKLSLFPWIAANFAGISLGFYLSWIVAYVSSLIIGGSLVSAIFGLTFGLILGICQGLVIKEVIRTRCWWIALTTLGGGLGFFVGNLGANAIGFWGGSVLGGTVGALVGLPQSTIMRSQLGKGRKWWITNAIAGAICGLIATVIPGWGIPLGAIIFGAIAGFSWR